MALKEENEALKAQVADLENQLAAANAVNETQQAEIEALTKARDKANNAQGVIAVFDGYSCELLVEKVKTKKGEITLYSTDDDGNKVANEDGVKQYLDICKYKSSLVMKVEKE